MPAAKELSRADEILMVVILVLGENAYSTTILSELARRAKKKVTVGSLWVSLDQLVKRGYVRKRTGGENDKVGGRPRVYYAVSKRGLQALKRTRSYQERIWKGGPGLDEIVV